MINLKNILGTANRQSINLSNLGLGNISNVISNVTSKRKEEEKQFEEEKQKTVRTLPSGGQYLFSKPDTKYSDLQRQSRAYGTMEIKTGYERDYIILVALGGTSDDPNMEYLESNKNLLQQLTDKPASARNRQEGKMLVEWSAINDYKKGKIGINEARQRVLNWNNQPEKDYKLYAESLAETTKNTFGGLGKEMLGVLGGALDFVVRTGLQTVSGIGAVTSGLVTTAAKLEAESKGQDTYDGVSYDDIWSNEVEKATDRAIDIGRPDEYFRSKITGTPYQENQLFMDEVRKLAVSSNKKMEEGDTKGSLIDAAKIAGYGFMRDWANPFFLFDVKGVKAGSFKLAPKEKVIWQTQLNPAKKDFLLGKAVKTSEKELVFKIDTKQKGLVNTTVKGKIKPQKAPDVKLYVKQNKNGVINAKVTNSGGEILDKNIMRAVEEQAKNINPALGKTAEQAIVEAQGQTLNQVLKPISTEMKAGLPTINNISKTVKKVISARPDPLAEEAKILRGTKGLTADQIMETYPNIKLTKDVQAKDVYGNKVEIPEGEKLTPYQMKDGKVVLQDGQTYVVTKNQFANIKGQSIGGEAKPFAPELKGTEETVNINDFQGRKLTPSENAEMNELSRRLSSEGLEGADKARWNELAKIRNQQVEFKSNTKYSQYQLPEGKNYKEILIKAPEAKIKKPMSKAEFEDINSQEYTYANYQEYLDEFNKGNETATAGMFKSSHWDEPNVLSHLRMNNRTYKGKDVTFMEELQSDWAREGRDKGFAKDTKLEWKKDGDEIYTEIGNRSFGIKPEGDRFYVWEDGGNLGHPVSSIADAKAEISRIVNEGVPNNPLLKKWQEMSVKRALIEAVNNKSDYFAWINGEQTSARYNLSTQVDRVEWENRKIELTPKEGKVIEVDFDKKGVIKEAGQWQGGDFVDYKDWTGKKLDEVIGKGLADKIMAKEKGTLTDEGLSFGGEWASNLYDKQVANIVKKLTGADVIKMDMGLPIGEVKTSFYRPESEMGDIRFAETDKIKQTNLKVGKEIYERKSDTQYIITDILGDGKFKAVKKTETVDLAKQFPMEEVVQIFKNDKTLQSLVETFDISTKTTTQQGIKLTPEVVSKIKGEAPVIKTSGKMFEDNKPTAKPITKAPKQPSKPVKVEKGTKPTKQQFSTHYEKIKEQFGFDQAGVERDKIVNKESIRKAFNYLQRNPEKGMRIAYGFEQPPKGILLNHIRQSAVVSLYEQGKIVQAEEIAKKLSLGLTQQAQELQAGNSDLTPQAQITQSITKKRLEKIGMNLGEVKVEKAVERAKKEIKTKSKSRAKEVVKKEVGTLESIDNLIDSLLC